MRVFVTGASGFVGGAVVRELVARGHTPVALSNRRPVEGVGNARASLYDPAALATAMAGCDAVIHLVGIIRETGEATFEHVHVDGTTAVVDAAGRAGVGRYVHMSAAGTRAGAEAAYHRTKWRAEERVRASGLAWTIFRPDVIHGPGGELMAMEAAWARGSAVPWVFMPYFGRGLLGRGGAAPLRPVYVDDIARAFVDALTNSTSVGRTYSLLGPESLTWPAFHRAIATAIRGRPKATVAIPAWYALLLTRLVPAAWLPFNRDQVLMATTTVEPKPPAEEFVRDFGWKPGGFASCLASYAAALRNPVGSNDHGR